MEEGRWDLRLMGIPQDVLDSVVENGFIMVTNTYIDPRLFNDATMKAQAIFTGIVWTKEVGDHDEAAIGGPSLVAAMGDSQNRGDIFETNQSLSSATLDTCITTLLPATTGLTKGTINEPGGTHDGDYHLVTPKAAIQRVSDDFGSEWRLNPDGSLDAGPEANLFVTTPTAYIVRRAGDFDPSATGVRPNEMKSVVDAGDWVSEVLLLGQFDGNAVVNEDATLTDIGGANPYKNFAGTALNRKVLVNEGFVPSALAQSRAEFHLTELSNLRQTVSISTDTHVIGGDIAVGDTVYAFDPPLLEDTGNQVPFMGDFIHPLAIRVVSMSWPVRSGMGVYYRDGDGNYTDLTPYIEFEDRSATNLDIGELTRDPWEFVDPNAADRPLNMENNTIPAAPAAANTPWTSDFLSPSERNPIGVARVIVEWTVPLNTDGSTIVDGALYIMRYRDSVDTDYEFRTIPWGTNKAELGNLIPGRTYNISVAAQDTGGNVGAFFTDEDVVAPGDTTAPSTPTAPTATVGEGVVVITHDLQKAATGDLEDDLHHLEIHRGTSAGFSPSSSTHLGDVSATWANIVASQDASFIDGTGTGGTTYYYKVIAVDNSQNSSTASAASGATVYPQPATLPVDWPDITNDDFTNVPKVPTGLSATSVDNTDVYLDGNGIQRAVIHFSWSEVTENTDLSSITDRGYYEIRWKLQAETNYNYMTVVWQSGTPPTIDIDNLAVNTGYHVSVQAVDTWGNASGYATNQAVTSANDTVAPSAPAAPTVTGDVVHIQIDHDLTKSGGGNLENDIAAMQLWRHTSTFTPPGTGTLLTTFAVTRAMLQSNQGISYRDGQNTNSTFYYRFIAIDQAGNTSTAGDEASGAASYISASELADNIINSTSFTDLFQTTQMTAITIDRGATAVEGLMSWDSTGNFWERYNGSSWEKLIGSDDIIANSLTSASGIFGTLDATQLTLTNIDSSNMFGATTTGVIINSLGQMQIQNGTGTTSIDGGNIAAHTILANQVVVADYENLIRDPVFATEFSHATDDTVHFWQNGGGAWSRTEQGTGTGNYYAQHNAGNSSQAYIEFNGDVTPTGGYASRHVETEVGETFYFAVELREVSANMTLGAVTIDYTWMLSDGNEYRDDGTTGSPNEWVVGTDLQPSLTTSWQTFSVTTAAAPTSVNGDAVGIRFRLRADANIDAAFRVRNPRLRRRGVGNLVVDGEITADKLTIDSAINIAAGGQLNIGSMAYGDNVGGAGWDGLYIDSNNFWRDTGHFRVGDAGTDYMEFTGGTLTIRGTLTADDMQTGTLNASLVTISNADETIFSDDGISVASDGTFTMVDNTATVIDGGNIATDTVYLRHLAFLGFGNALPDPGFESNTAEGEYRGLTASGGTFSVVATNVRSGGYCLRYDPTSQTGVASIRSGTAGTDTTKMFPTGEGEQWSVSAWGRQSSGGTGRMRVGVRFRDELGTTTGTSFGGYTNLSTSYQQITHTSTGAPAGTAVAQFELQIPDDTQTAMMHVDDMDMRKSVTSIQIADDIQSDNYDGTDVATNDATVGWRIERDTGSAEFTGRIRAGGVTIGNDAGGAGLDGIYIDSNNHWYEESTNNWDFRVGDATDYLFWDDSATTLTVKGTVNIDTGNVNGNLTFASGGVLRTASSGARTEITQTDRERISFYDATALVGYLGYRTSTGQFEFNSDAGGDDDFKFLMGQIATGGSLVVEGYGTQWDLYDEFVIRAQSSGTASATLFSVWDADAVQERLNLDVDGFLTIDRDLTINQSANNLSRVYWHGNDYIEANETGNTFSIVIDGDEEVRFTQDGQGAVQASRYYGGIGADDYIKTNDTQSWWQFYHDGAEKIRLQATNNQDSNPTIGFVDGNMGSTTGTNVVITDHTDRWELHADSSGEQFKQDIEALGTQLVGTIDQLVPKQFRFKGHGPRGEDRQPLMYGLVAQDVAAALPVAAIYNRDQEIIDYNNRAVMALQVLEIQDLRRRVAALESR